MKDDRGDQNRHRNRRQRDQGGPGIQEKHEEDDGNDDDGFKQNLLHIADRGFDEVGLPEEDLIGLDARRQGRADLPKGGLDLSSQFHSIDIRLLFYRDDNCGLTLITGVSTFQARREADFGNLSQDNWLTIDTSHDDVCEIFDVLCATDISDQELAAVLVGEAATGVRAELRQSLFDLFEGHAECPHGGRVRRNAILANLAPDRNDLGHTRNAQDPRSDGEISEFPQLHGRDIVRPGHGNEHDLTHDRVDRAHLRHDIRRQLRLYKRQPLGDLLAVAIDIRVPVELDVDDRETDARCRADAAHPGKPIHLGFERIGDELFDFFRCQPLCLRHDGDGRSVEIGEDVNGQPRDRKRPVDHEDCGNRQDEQAVAQRLGNEKIEHRSLSGSGSGVRHPV